MDMLNLKLNNSEETRERVACFAKGFHNPFFAKFSTGVVIVIYIIHVKASPRLSRSQLKLYRPNSPVPVSAMDH